MKFCPNSSSARINAIACLGLLLLTGCDPDYKKEVAKLPTAYTYTRAEDPSVFRRGRLSGAQPMTVALNNLVNTDTGVKQYNVDMAGAIIAALPTLVVYVLAGKYFLRGLTAGAVKG